MFLELYVFGELLKMSIEIVVLLRRNGDQTKRNGSAKGSYNLLTGGKAVEQNWFFLLLYSASRAGGELLHGGATREYMLQLATAAGPPTARHC